MPAPPASARIVISPELRALFRAHRGLGGGAPAGAPAPAAPEGWDLAPARPARRAGEAAPLHRRRLRRDGLRPLIFTGMALVEAEQPGETPGLRQGFGLYLASCGRLAAGLALLPEPGGIASAVHAAAFIETKDELTRLIGSVDPADAVPHPDCRPPDRRTETEGIAHSIAADYRRFADAVLRLAPLSSSLVQSRGRT